MIECVDTDTEGRGAMAEIERQEPKGLFKIGDWYFSERHSARQEPLIQWSTIRGVGGIEFLRVSYAAVALLPFAAAQNRVTELVGYDPGWKLALSYLSALFIAIGKAVYDLGCPANIKRFDRWEDLYLYEKDTYHTRTSSANFDDHRAKAQGQWDKDNDSRQTWRHVSTIMFAFGALLSVVLIGDRTCAVLQAVT